MNLAAIDVSTAKDGALVGLVVLAVIAVLVIFVVQKIILKLVVLVVVVVLGSAVWSQRSSLADCPKTCSCSFFGYQLQLDDPTLNDACLRIVN